MLTNNLKQKLCLVLSMYFFASSLFCNPNEENISIANNPSDIKLPDGFRIDIYADDVPNARSMTLGSNGTVFVGTRDDDKVYALVDSNKDFKVDNVITIASGLNTPNGVAFNEGALYVAEINKIWRFDNIENNLSNPPSPVLISENLPDDNSHGWKFIAVGPDGKLYVPVGAPCNICLREDNPQYASITRMNIDGSGHEVFVSGVRNSVGFDWHPATGELWFTDNGRDWLGDNIPPDELNRAHEKGLHFGYPFMHGNDIRDPEFGEGKDLNQYTKPAKTLGAHVAALGMRFYNGDMFPASYKNQIFIAEHGSWNRSAKIGYRVMIVKLNGNNVVSYEPFAEGWLKGESVSGRPVDILELPDGSLLVSDDYAGLIYRISYKGNK